MPENRRLRWSDASCFIERCRFVLEKLCLRTTNPGRCPSIALELQSLAEGSAAACHDRSNYDGEIAQTQGKPTGIRPADVKLRQTRVPSPCRRRLPTLSPSGVSDCNKNSLRQGCYRTHLCRRPERSNAPATRPGKKSRPARYAPFQYAIACICAGIGHPCPIPDRIGECKRTGNLLLYRSVDEGRCPSRGHDGLPFPSHNVGPAAGPLFGAGRPRGTTRRHARGRCRRYRRIRVLAVRRGRIRRITAGVEFWGVVGSGQ